MRLRVTLIVGSIVGGASLLGACTHTVEGTGDGSSGASSSGTSSSGASSSGLVALSASQLAGLCKLLVTDCRVLDGTVVDCARVFQALRTTTSCANMFGSGTCSSISEVESSCFPACNVAIPPTCKSDGTISTCVATQSGAGEQLTLSCADGCSGRGTTYSGTCGLEGPAGELSDDGKPQCWCN